MNPKRVVFIGADWPENERWCPHFMGVKAGLKKLDIPFIFVSCRPTLNVDTVIAFEPDLVIYGLADMIKHRDWRSEIRERLPNTKIVLWYGDYRDQRMVQLDADCSELDMMFVSNDAQEEHYKHKWKMKRVKFLPLGCEPIDVPAYDKRFSFPFVFIGGRITGGAFNARAKEIGDFDLQSELTIINSYEPDIRTNIYKAMPSIYSSSKIALDISHFTNIQGYTSIRYWEIPAFYGFALTKRWPGCEDFYPQDTRIYFDTLEEALELKDYYLQHETERQKIVAKAHKLSYNHSYDNRFKQMFKLLEGV